METPHIYTGSIRHAIHALNIVIVDLEKSTRARNLSPEKWNDLRTKLQAKQEAQANLTEYLNAITGTN